MSKNEVALRKESVDRNSVPNRLKVTETVALRKESVDRNKRDAPSHNPEVRSLSARRAWIEICCLFRAA